MTLNIPGIQNLLDMILFAFRVIVPFVFLIIVWRCFASLKRGRRREDPVVILEDMVTHETIPVLYWENSIGRSKSCDIVLNDPTASRDHAVLMRRESGWIITDTGSKSGTFVSGTKIKGPYQVMPGDVMAMGSTALMLKRANNTPKKKKWIQRRAASPFGLLTSVTFIQIFLVVQACFAADKFSPMPLIPFGVLQVLEWGLYFYSIKGLGRVSFELETMAFLLSGTGILLIAGTDVKSTFTQLGALAGGIILFCVMIQFLSDLDRVMRWRLAIAVFAILLFAANLLLARTHNGARNWIKLGSFSVQPSEFIKIAFIFVGASTLDRLQTARNLTGFIGFSAVCMGALFLMRDFGTACIFFVTFLIIAFMRSGSLRTIALICSVAAFGAFLILKFKPYVADRINAWGHVWEHVNDSGGYQQTRVLSYAASGGLFGVGIGKGCLKNVFASTTDLVFGMVCEELGLALALLIVLTIALLMFYARSDATRSRSTFYSISACAASGMLLFQTCLNVFGATDVLPLTGVTLPLISLGGSSMMAVWGLLAFIKASDERTYAARRKS
ncbi:FtsW/RodA/SpoVE family cell cycle protein [Caproiciproducens galactitolivorans]|uniref:FtsW/RodA/SpoVE family cell cycle protein n=1 Tax=Caproiciproducens galactitolivorans TaxID=642589 RepID=A0ABT4BQW7_9FIRM|nr:FtsW/RodA/SpoVE family cell cycle protein [Caproiciproducens galactitolivorans]MCY1713274.1 FtsW/RodA/SpoVE family cell cycle protein [Caproiciproducens galactitolivorans]